LQERSTRYQMHKSDLSVVAEGTNITILAARCWH
jgi:hypothetical protein